MRYTIDPAGHGRDYNIAVVCNSMGEMVDLAIAGATPGYDQYTSKGSMKSFFAKGFDASCDATIMGDNETVDATMELLVQFRDLEITTTAKTRVKTHHGRAHIPSLIIGKPKPCRRWKVQPIAHAPLTIIVNVTTSASVPHKTMMRRGTAIAAMVAQLAKVRPVSLYLAVTGEIGGVATFIAAKFPTSPCDISRLSFVLSSNGFARALGFAAMRGASNIHRSGRGLGKTVSGYVSWPFDSMKYIGGSSDGSVTRAKGSGANTAGALFAKELAPGNSDVLYFGATYLGSATHASIDQDPVAWVKAMLKEYT